MRMKFETLKLVERRQPRVLVAQVNDEANRNQRVLIFIGQVIEERATAGL